MKLLKEIYNLSYDLSGFNSGLINWYNKLIDKSYDDLTVADVSRMIRQDILQDIAIKRVIELFLSDPYDGEYSDGGLLDLLVSLNINSLDMQYSVKLKSMLEHVSKDFIEFEWSDDETKEQYAKNIESMVKKLESM